MDNQTYNPITPEVLDALRQIVGAEEVLVDPEALEPYTHDETVGLYADPEAVVRVTSAEQVSEIFSPPRAG